MKSVARLLGAAILASAVSAVQEPKKRPIERVVALLVEMKKDLEKNAEMDGEVFQKFQCWCAKVRKQAAKDIDQAQKDIVDLQGKIESSAGTIAATATEMEDLQKTIDETQKDLDEAIALRKKQLAEFNENEKDQLVALNALKSAIEVLSKHHEGKGLLEVRSLLAQVPWETTVILSEDDRSKIASLVQSKAHKDFFGAKNIFDESYASQSGAIFGILKNMYDQFKNNLGEAQKAELENAKQFAELKEEKESMLVTLKENLGLKTEQNRAANELNAKSKELLQATREMLDANRAFLADAEMKCQKMEQEAEVREKERKEEVAAVNKAIEILRAGDHRAATNTFNFLQLSTVRSVRRASTWLFATARRLHSPKLTEIAALMQTSEVSGAMGKVIRAIEKMQAELKKDQTDEVAKRDYCVETKATLEREAAQLKHDIETAEAEQEEQMQFIQKFDQEIVRLEEENTDIREETEEARKVRVKENKEFEHELADNLATRDTLNKAMIALKNYYEKGTQLVQQAPIRVISDEDYEAQKGMKKDTRAMEKEKEALQKKQDSMQSVEDQIGGPVGGFSRYKVGGGNRVISMLEQIINETEELENQMKLDEKDAQEIFDKLESDNNKRIADNERLIEENKSNMADAQESLQQATEALNQATSDQEENVRNYAAAKEECDWLLANFDKRQEARAAEIAALDEAKGFLMGAVGGSYKGNEGTVKAQYDADKTRAEETDKFEEKAGLA